MTELPKGTKTHCNRIVDGVREKRCSQCLEWLPATSEFFHIKSGIRLHSSCIPCALPLQRAANQARYAKANPGARPKRQNAGNGTAQIKQRFDASALVSAMGTPK